MKIFLIINFVMSLVLVSCDASMMFSNSDEELKPINIVGTYRCENKKYYVRVIKDDGKDSGYLLEFTNTGVSGSLGRPDSYTYDSDKKSFTFDMKEGRKTINYILLFEEEGYPMLTVDTDELFRLLPYSGELF